MNPTITQVLTAVNEPSLKDLLDLYKQQTLLDLNCHHIGTVQSFDKDAQTVTATINYKKTFFTLNPLSGIYDPVLVDYPILLDCPVVVLGGGNAKLTFPIAQGDECLIIFNDRNIDNWFQSGQAGPVATARLHSFSDGIALVGLQSLNKSIKNYDTTRAVLRNGDDGLTMVGVGPTLIKIANNTTTLNTLLQNLVTQLENLVTATAAITVTGVTTGPGVSGPPANAAVIVAIGTTLTTIATQISGLLE